MQTTNSTVAEGESISREVALSLSNISDARVPRNPSQTREGYGFRPRSGLATPQITQDEEVNEAQSPIPDQYGLGWPGILFRWVSPHKRTNKPGSQIHAISPQLNE